MSRFCLGIEEGRMAEIAVSLSKVPSAKPGWSNSFDAVECDSAAIMEHVARILRSPPFARAPRMQRFLGFLVEETLAGRVSRLKEHSIAVSVFDKSADFETRNNPVVRV